MLRAATLLITLVLSSACNAHVFSPPTGTFPVESSQTVGLGKHGVRGDLFAGGAMFGPQIVAFRGSYRHGVRDKLELSAAPTLIHIQGRDRGDSSPNMYALRVGAKYAPVKHFAVIGGAGGGGSAAGGFISPDLGIIGAFENRYFVPFGSLRGLVSAPINPRSVHFTTGDDASDGSDDENGDADSYRLTPKLTFGYELALGARVPFTHDDAAEVKPSLACALGITTLNDLSEDEGYSGFSCAVDVVF
jgi:hypothetical protein